MAKKAVILSQDNLNTYINPANLGFKNMIDKLELAFSASGLDVAEASELWKINGVRVSKEKYIGKKVLCLHYNGIKAYLNVRQRGEKAYGLASNPSRYTSKFKDFISFIEATIPKRYIDTSTLMRLDLAVDYHLPFEKLISGIRVSNKQSWNRYGVGRRVTGLYIGKGNHLYAAYDKVEEQKRKRKNKIKFKNPTSRVEMRLKGSRKPRYIYDLPQWFLKNLSREGRFWPMSDLELYHVDFVEGSSGKAKDQLYFEKTKDHFNLVGMNCAIKTLSAGKNLYKDRYKKYVSLELFSPQPDELLRDYLADYFELKLDCVKSKPKLQP